MDGRLGNDMVTLHALFSVILLILNGITVNLHEKLGQIIKISSWGFTVWGF